MNFHTIRVNFFFLNQNDHYFINSNQNFLLKDSIFHLIPLFSSQKCISFVNHHTHTTFWTTILANIQGKHINTYALVSYILSLYKVQLALFSSHQ